jgi:ribose/xylose/arabinose/galactoside ABC-type transport system permease subunit
MGPAGPHHHGGGLRLFDRRQGEMTSVSLGGAGRRESLSWRRFVPAGALVALVVIGAALQPSFVSLGNLQNITTQAAPLLIVTLGQAIVMLARGLDLSVASLMATTAVLAAAFNSNSNADLPAIVASALALSALVGLVNGWLITKRNVSPFIATLAMMIVLQGLRFAYTKGAPSGSLPPGLRYLGAGRLAEIPVNLLVFLVLFAILAIALARTAPGRALYMVGGNPRAAELVGVRADLVTLGAYVAGSMLAGLAGLLLVGYVGAVDNWVGRGYELDSIVAAVIGGVSLSGGAGSLAGAAAGGLALVLISNIVVILGLPVQAQLVIKGVIIIVAAALSTRDDRRG